MKKKIYILLIVLCFILLGCQSNNSGIKTTSNPHNVDWLDDEMIKTLESVKRVDDNGVLYEMNYSADYYATSITDILNEINTSIDAGCSAFSTYNTDHDFLLCRNYDYHHKDNKGETTGLHVVVNMAPEGKLKSIGICDAYWLNQNAYFAGCLDDGETDTTNLLLIPYMCVDGMNEAGLSASLLVADVKKGETFINQNTGKSKSTLSMLLRYIMDDAHNIEEAIKIAESYDIFSTGGTDLHMYLSQPDGTSAVFEWRQYEGDEQQKLYVTYTNACTNFYVGFDDGEDAYREDGSLKELFTRITPTFNNYKYGYGHGYHRFNQIVSTLERYIETDKNNYGIRNSIMEEFQALDVLRVISQGPGVENTSFTQYSAIYNLADLSVNLYLQRDYNKSYSFSIN